MQNKEELLLKMLALSRYLSFARRNNVTESVILSAARDLGFLADAYDAEASGGGRRLIDGSVNSKQ